LTLTHLKHLSLAIAITAALGACKKADDAAPAAATATAAAAPAITIDVSKLPALPHFDAADLDANTPICTDLNAHVNGKWLAANPIPADKTSWGNFNMLGDRSLEAQKQIVEQAAKGSFAAGSNEQKLGAFYRLGMDEAKLNADGLAPVKATVAKVDAIADNAGVVQYLYDSFAHGDAQVFQFMAAEDFKDASKTTGYAFEAGLSLPERAYYLEPAYQPQRDAFVAHVERMLVLGGVDAAAAKAQAADVLAVETRLAKASLTPIESRDPANQYHWVSIAEGNKATPHFDWSKFLAAEHVSGVDGFSLSQPKFFAEFDRMLADLPTTQWKNYLRYHVLNDAAPFLSDAASDENFAFYGKTLSGQPEQKARWKRVLGSINGTMGEALGQIYVKQVFPEESKAAMKELVGNLRLALKDRLQNLEWMSADTKAKALEKLNTFDPKIGYPDKWRDFSGLSFEGKGSYYDTVMAAAAFENAYRMAKIGKPVDRQEWGMSPQTVNAYYNPSKNEIVFPAAILQPPFFDPKADPALNYGGIGAVIGHEIMHGFDDQGSQFDALGNNANWWTDADRKLFNERTARLVKQFDDYTVNGKHVKGQLTLGENIGDLGGIAIAYDALQKDLANKRIGEIDGFTQDQRFFLNFATIWRGQRRPEAMEVMLNTNPHAPEGLRANGAPSNMDQFAQAFSCKAGDAMVRGGDKKVAIW
jgi:putative endopeptidase